MFEIFKKNKEERGTLSKNDIVQLLKTTPEALSEFEKAYINYSDFDTDNFFKLSSRQASEMNHRSKKNVEPNNVRDIINRIVDELLLQTAIYDSETDSVHTYSGREDAKPVTNEEILALPEEIRPQLTGSLAKVDINEPASNIVMWYYQQYLKTNKKMFYDEFRIGLDILDIDPLLYKIIGCNKNSMGYWLPALVRAAKEHSFFKIPKTKIMKVPLTLLQLTRQDYMSLTPTTISIVDEFCHTAFQLNDEKEYFIKTGTYSSKFDFRNCYVHGQKEVQELGEYLLFIHFQALQMASPFSTPRIYGVSTTNEWVVREYIAPKDHIGKNGTIPHIYQTMPLRTEYRVFVDLDTGEILGINPYWDPKVMKKRFSQESDSNEPNQVYNYIVFTMYEDILMEKYEKNKEKVLKEMEKLISDLYLTGQWAIDVMQNGDDFWIIDMSLAENSALKECVPKRKLKKSHENWIPKID